MEDKRPNPDEILARINENDGDSIPVSKKGRLKIFLGYCPGVGKTYRMLQEAGANRKNGVDVVIAMAMTHGRSETQALLAGLEAIPLKKIDYSGLALEEMDIDAVLARKPAIALVDEFAHTNAPGSRHAKRYQDVEELLNAGIDVYTTLNIQHIESLVDIVQQTSGVKVSETVPDSMLELADEVELVDLTPEKLIERLKEGKVYIPKKAEQAMRQFFKKGNLLALRELSLHYTAKHVDDDARLYMGKHAAPGPWPVGSRLLVGITASSSSERLLRFTHRMSQDLNAEWFAVYVQSPQQIQTDQKARVQMDRNIRLAEELGAQVVSLQGSNVADEILDFAKENNVTLIVAGPSRRTFKDRLLKGSVLDKLINKSGPINVLIAGTSEYEKGNEVKYTFMRKIDYRAYAASFLALAVTVAIGWVFRSRVEPVNIGMLLLLPAIASGLLWGIRVGIFASFLAVASFDFFFVPPYLTFRISDIRYLPSFIVFMLVSVIISYLAKSVRQEAASSRHRERFIYSLYSFSRAIMAAEGLTEILERAVKSISEAFESDTVIFLPDKAGRVHIKERSRHDISLSGSEMAVAAWVHSNGQPAGKSTGTLSSALWYYMPLKLQDETIGVIGLKTFDPDKFLTSEQDQLLESFASIVALSIAKTTEK
jgi:two-component system sensor histidine kinase KdpD